MSREMDRRTFLRTAGLGAAVVGAGAATWRLRRSGEPAPWDGRAFPPPSEARVAVLKVPTYDGNLEAALLDGLRAIGIDVRSASVLLKPNLVEYDPGTVINTDPRLVASAVLAFRRMGARTVTVADGPAHRRDTVYVVERSGMGDALRAVDAPFIDLNVDEVRRVRLDSRYTDMEELWLPRSVVDADVVVSMPKMKMHHWAGVTLSLKNCFGCIPGRVYGWPKNILHWVGIEPAILDVAAAVRPDLAIVDGVTAMQGNGPLDGTAVSVGVVVVADDPVAADVVSAGLMGVDPSQLAYLAEAGRFLGQANPERIVTAGEDASHLGALLEPAPGFEHIIAT